MLLFADPEGLQAQAEEGARFGYTGESVFCSHFSLLLICPDKYNLLKFDESNSFDYLTL